MVKTFLKFSYLNVFIICAKYSFTVCVIAGKFSITKLVFNKGSTSAKSLPLPPSLLVLEKADLTEPKISLPLANEIKEKMYNNCRQNHQERAVQLVFDLCLEQKKR